MASRPEIRSILAVLGVEIPNSVPILLYSSVVVHLVDSAVQSAQCRKLEAPTERTFS